MNDIWFIIIFIGSVFISSVSQILLKKSAQKTYPSKLKEYFNIQVIAAYAMFFGSAVITMFAYSRISLSLGPVLESSGYIFILFMGVLILKEKISFKKLAGMLFIICGILLSTAFAHSF